MTALLRGAVAGSATGLLGTLATLRLHDIRTGDEPSVLIFGLAAGLGAGAALGAGCESPSRRLRFGAGILAALLGFALFAGAVLLAAGKLPWDGRWAPSVFLLQHGLLGLARLVLTAGLALGGGEVAAPALSRGAGPLLRAWRALVVGSIAAALAGVSIATGEDATARVWFHLVALVPLAAGATFVTSLVSNRREECAAAVASPSSSS